MVIHRRLDGAFRISGLQLPRVAALAVHEARVVIALVHELQDGREDLGFFVRESYALCVSLGKILVQRRSKERREAENVLMGGEEAVFVADDERDYRG